MAPVNKCTAAILNHCIINPIIRSRVEIDLLKVWKQSFPGCNTRRLPSCICVPVEKVIPCKPGLLQLNFKYNAGKNKLDTWLGNAMADHTLNAMNIYIYIYMVCFIAISK